MRFPTALAEAYGYFCREQKVTPEAWVVKALQRIGAEVGRKPPKLMDHACEVLKSLSAKHSCILYTLGDKRQQIYRLNAVSLASYFTRVFVVLHKDEDVLLRILTELRLKTESTWMIGNSASSDIKPALALGLNCIWLRGEHWLFDDAHIDVSSVHQIGMLNEIFPIIENWEQGEGS